MQRGWTLVMGIVIGGALGVFGTALLGEKDDAATAPPLLAEPDDVARESDAPLLGTGAENAPEDTEGALPPSAPRPGDLHVTKAAFVEAYRASFEARTGVLPTGAQEDAAWESLQAHALSAGQASGASAASVHVESLRKAEIRERDDIMALLADDNRKNDVRALRNDPEAFVRLLAHKAEPLHVDGERHLAGPSEEGLADGTVLSFRPGVYLLTEAAVLGQGPRQRMPRDLTIEGSGMDRTLIRLSDLSARDLVYNLHLKDCTIDCGNDGAFDLRHERASVFAENVRFVRFDAGHGGCYVFSLRGGAVYCRDCRFDGGYGRSPGSGHILRHVDVARMEDCIFDRVSYQLGGHVPVTFAGCTFRDCERMEAALQRALAHPNPRRARFEDCRVESTLLADRLSRRKRLARDLKVLFPTFKGR